MRFIASLLFIGVLSAQQPPPEPAKPKRPMPEPKNLKVLKVPTSELIPMMRSFNAALGVQCVHCHVKGDFASDENPKKEMARTMITMLANVNTTLGGMATATCYTCHRGEVEPKSAPPGEAAAPEGTPAPPKPPAQ